MTVFTQARGAERGPGIRSLRVRLVAWAVVLGALMMLMAYASTVYIMAQRLKAEYAAHEQNALTQIAGQIDAAINDLDSRLWLINTSDRISELMRTPKPWDGTGAEAALGEIEGALGQSELVERAVLFGRNDYLAVIERGKLIDQSRYFHYQDFASDADLSPYFSGRQGARYVHLADDGRAERSSVARVRRLVDGRCVLTHPVFSEENIILGAVIVTLKRDFLTTLAEPYLGDRRIAAYAGSGAEVWQAGEGDGSGARARTSLKTLDLTLESSADRNPYLAELEALVRRPLVAFGGCLFAVAALSMSLAQPVYRPLRSMAQALSTGEPLDSGRASRVMRIFRKLSLPSALMWYFAITVTLPTLAFGLLSAAYGYEVYEQALAGHALSMTRQLVGGVDRRFEQLEDLSGYLAEDGALRDMPGSNAQPLTDAQRGRMDDLARRAKMLNNQLMSINLYSLSGRNIYSSLYLEHQPAAMFQGDLLRTLRKGAGGLVYMGLAKDLYPDAPVRVGWRLAGESGSGEPWGYMVAWLNQNVLAEATRSIRMEKSGYFFVLDTEGGALNHESGTLTAHLLSDESMTTLLSSPGGAATVWLNGQAYDVFASQPGTGGMRVVGVVPQSELAARVLPAVQAVLALCAVYTLVSVLVARQAAKRIAEPLKHLRRLLADAGDGQWEEMKYGGRNEIATLVDQYNRMVLRLDQLITENYRARLHESRLLLAEREAQLKALQQQINPHFLYNTLDAIKWMAHKRGAMEAYDMAIALGNFFRGVISNQSDVITVAEEIEHLKNYLYIQQIRFAGRFQVVWQVDERALPVRTLKLILQPLVENAIVHGMAEVEDGGAIIISAALHGDFLTYSVIDNGAGIEREPLEALRMSLRDDASVEGPNSIGLVNVARRLRLHFGASSNIVVESAPGEGTKVTVRIPLVL